ncbi:MAG: hypothetical protein U0Y10_11190 [Spirosomataceae bacterium]
MENEYKTLRDEIAQYRLINSNIYIANITVTAVLLGYAIKDNPIWYMFLSPFFIIIPSIILIATNISLTARIGTYILVFIESNEDALNWETNLQKLRNRDLMMSKKSSFTTSILLLFILLSGFCLTLCCIYLFKDNDIDLLSVTSILVVLISLCLAFLQLRKVSRRKYIDNYINSWLEVKSDSI